MGTALVTTGAEFDALPYEEGRKWELLEGELVEVSSATFDRQDFALTISEALRSYFRQHRVGKANADVEFALSPEDRVRPDVFVLLNDRLPFQRNQVPIPGAPDIAVEVISPSERSAVAQKKVQRYLAGGTREVWQIYPELRVAVIHTPDGAHTVSTIETALLPGFSLSMDQILAG